MQVVNLYEHHILLRHVTGAQESYQYQSLCRCGTGGDANGQKKLERYKPLKRELLMIDKQISKLEDAGKRCLY